MPLEFHMNIRIAMLLSAAFVPGQAMAQTQPAEHPATEAAAPADRDAARAEPQDHVHEQEPEEIVVTAHFVRQLDLLGGTATMSGTTLARNLQPQLGDTLARLPGVSATSFSPGASRPVLRGFGGERVRVLVDGIGSIDVSNTSADHAVTIDPITADRIEVLHGPAVLLFGGQAIGGAVNVFDRRIPRRVPDDNFVHVDAIAAYGSAADEVSLGGGADFALGGGLVLHLDGSWRDTNDLRIGGFVLAPELRADTLADADEEEAEGHADEAAELRALANQRGVLPNSATRQSSGGAGLALIRDWGSIGGSLSFYDSRYGVPSRPGAGHHHEAGGAEEAEAPVTIGMEQLRGDLRAQINLGSGLFEQLRLRFAAADYSHIEYEGDAIGTLFENQGMEGRVELTQADRNGWRGAVGAQFFHRSFDASGAEAFLRANTTSQFGLFALQEIELGAGVQIELAGRYERTDIRSDFLNLDRSFDAVSVAAGASVELLPLVRAGVNLSRSERAPSAEELFSDGPHVATQAYETGDPGFRTERSIGGEAFVRIGRPSFTLSGTVYYNRFDNFIFSAATGALEDGLPVFQYRQADAEHLGFELGVDADIAQVGDVRFGIEGAADYVAVTIDGAGDAPRIPPLRIRAGARAHTDALEGRVEVEHVFEQDRIAAFETPTDAFTMVNAALTWRPLGRDDPTSLTLSANNLFDVDARRHASFTKDFVPLAGRDIRATLRLSF